MTPQLTLLLTMIVPLVGAMGILVCRRLPNLREAVTLTTAVAVFGLVLKLYGTALSDEVVRLTLLEIMPGIPLSFHLEPLGMVFALVASGLWMLNSIYSIGYMRGNSEKHQTRFYFCFPLAIASAMGIAFSSNPLTMFVFYETLTLSTYPLVTHKGSPDAVRNGRTYLGVLLTTSVCFQLLAVVWIYSLTLGPSPAIESAEFTAGGIFKQALASDALGPSVLGLLFFLYIYGLGKAAIMPVHKWLPAAMVAPTPVSAFLHAVAVVKAGVFCVIKVVVYVFGAVTMKEIGGGDWLVYVAGATILAASLIALFQDNLKRRLAFSTVSQLSYIVLGAALMTPLSILAATMHIAAHALGKITLFFAAGSIYTAAHKTKVSELDGIGRRMPVTMAAFAIGTLSMIGVPPAAGFISKWFLLGGTGESIRIAASGAKGPEVFTLIVIIGSTLLNAAYFLPIVYRAFFRPLPPNPGKRHGEAPWPIVAALAGTATATLAFFVYPEPVLALARAVQQVVV